MSTTAAASLADGREFVAFVLAGERYGLYLSAVDRVVRAVDITPLPQAPDIVLGVINVQGQVIPVINLRRRFGLLEREIAVADQLVIAHTARRSVALLADAVSGLLECSSEDIVEAQSILADTQYIEGVVKLDDGMTLIHNLDTFLSLDEEAALDQAIGGR